jgi:hypothetical protein
MSNEARGASTCTYDISVLIDIQLLDNGIDSLIIRSMLDDLHGRLEIFDGDLTLSVTLNSVERGSNSFVIGLELVVDLLDHASDSLVQ